MEWWIYEGGERSERSFTKEELAEHPDVHADTRLQAIDGSLPVRARDVSELSDLFEENPNREDVSIGELLDRNTPSPDSTETTAPAPPGGFLKARREFSLEDLLFDPIRFFRRVEAGGSNVFALFVALLAGMIGECFRVTYAYLIPGYSIYIEQFVGDLGTDPGLSAVVLSAYCFLLVPILILVGTVLFSGLVHAVLWGKRWNNKPFDVTFKITCYASIGLLGGIIPWAGMPLGMLWALVLLVIGLIVIQEIPPRQAAFISLAPATLVLVGLLISRFLTS